MSETTTLAISSPTPPAPQPSNTAFANESGFELAQRMGRALASSTIVPPQFQGDANIGNCIIALGISQKMSIDPFTVMQNLNIIHGKPGWNSTFIIGQLNSCGRFSLLRFEVTGTGDDMSCIAWAYDKATGGRLVGPPVSIAMAKAEGWHGKSGSKWKTMPDLMLRYRSAAFFGRLYAPDVLMGMHSVEEVVDITDKPRKAKQMATASFGQEEDATIIEEQVEEKPAIPTGKKEIAEALRKKMDETGIPKDDLLKAMKVNDCAPPDATMLNQVDVADLQFTLVNFDKITALIK